MNKNTYASEDRIIEKAISGDILSELVDIINRMDSLISDWKLVTDCDEPEDFERKHGKDDT